MGLLQALKRTASRQVTALYGTSSSQRELTLQARAQGELRGGTGDVPAAPPSQGGSGQFLLSNSVTPGVKDQYRRAVLVFLLFCSAMNIVLPDVQSIDMAFCSYFDECHFDGLGPSTGDLTLCGWCDLYPDHKPAMFPRAWRAVRAWRRLRPPQGRHPMPWVVCAALAALIAVESQIMAIGLIILFDGYLRPYELLNARWRDFLPPTVGFCHHTMIVCPLRSGRPTKTRVWDDGIFRQQEPSMR